ncbi:hypothetical protein [Ralstonia pseudosolanacearum]|uniref:hypothetical protein n=1 Tax=Ralstonia pseudosolanacearum TaxID=1310165 RepID=UPI003CF1C8E9
MKILDSQFGKSVQKLLCKKLIEVYGAHFLVDICVDADVVKSWAKISKWDGQQWQLTYSLNHPDMQVDFNVMFEHKPEESALQPLIDRLVAVALKMVQPSQGLVDFLNAGGEVDGLTSVEKDVLKGRHTTHPMARIYQSNGTSILAEGPFEMIEGYLKFWTPTEPETFAILHPSLIAKITYSE